MNASARRTVVVGVALVAASIVALVWWMIRESPPQPAPERADASVVGSRAAVEAPSDVALLVSKGERSHDVEASTPDDAAELEDIARSTRTSAFDTGSLADDVYIHGHVELPAGCALDADARVVRGYGDFEWSAPKSFPLAADGTFEIPFPRGTSHAFLDFVSRAACLESPLDLGTLDPTREVVMHAILASGLRGRLRLDPGIARDAASFVGAKISVRRIANVGGDYRKDHGWMSRPNGDGRGIDVGIDENLAFEIDGLDPNSSYQLYLWQDGRVRARSPRVQVVAGKRAEFEFEVSSPARLGGRVVDASGAAITNASVVTTEVTDGWVRPIGRGSTQSRDDGTFDAEIYEGSVLGVHAFKPGYRRKDVDIEPIDAGESRSNVVLVLERGPSVAGRVVWPDGTPADGAHVEVAATYQTTALGSRPTYDYVQNATTDADGAFQVDVSSDLDVLVRARASRSQIEPGSGEMSRWRSGPDWRTENSSVAPGAPPVVLTLQPNGQVEGLVVDDRGEPVRAFTVLATMSLDERRSEPVSSDVIDEHGQFTLANLSRGEWNVEVRVATNRSVNKTIAAGAPGSRVRFEIPRTCRVSGTVVDASGTPTPRVKIHLKPASELTMLDAESDECGRFAFDDVVAGAFTLFARSESLGGMSRITLSPGDMLRKVVVRVP